MLDLGSEFGKVRESKLEIFNQPIYLDGKAIGAVIYFRMQFFHVLVLEFGTLCEQADVALDHALNLLSTIRILLKNVYFVIHFSRSGQGRFYLVQETAHLVFQPLYPVFMVLELRTHVIDLRLFVLGLHRRLF